MKMSWDCWIILIRNRHSEYNIYTDWRIERIFDISGQYGSVKKSHEVAARHVIDIIGDPGYSITAEIKIKRGSVSLW